MTHRLTARDARRIAIRAQLLDAERPTELLGLVHRLGFVQHDLTRAVAPSAELVCWSRLGSEFRAEHLARMLAEGRLIEFRGLIRPAADLALFRADMEQWPGPEPLRPWQRNLVTWLDANERCRRDILDRLRADGPLPSRELPDTCVVPWRSSGWNHHRNVSSMLGLMEQRGEVAVAGVIGRDRLWDLAERIHPDVEAVPRDQARVERARRRLAALGIARATGPECPIEPNDVGDVGEPATVDGVRGTWRVDPAQLDRPFRGRTALLSPLDRLVFDRKRMADLFAFDYQLEMYKPAATRRWGYFALPILHGDRLVGKLDATADHDAGVLHVDAIHADEPATQAATRAIRAELADLAAWLGLRPVGPGLSR